ncbi:MAG: methyltransferase [Gammaproteobacteria bacterium]|nr:methyltransferase [Gammaproteobacteria bacterium]
MAETTISPEDYDSFRDYLESACGIILGDNKHYLVTSRLNRLMKEFSISCIGELVKQSEKNRQLHNRIVDAMTTNETFWFRDNHPFDILKDKLLPEFAANTKRIQPFRIWSAAASSGQEAYSISMMIEEFIQSRPGSLKQGVQIIGTDISPTMLEEAKAARYDKAAIFRGITEERKKKFFTEKGIKWEVNPAIRNRASFTELNLMNDYATLGKFDIIYCRNVLIYFSSDTKRDIISRMARALNPGGYLFVGASESLNYSEGFEMVRCNPGVVYKLK